MRIETTSQLAKISKDIQPGIQQSRDISGSTPTNAVALFITKYQQKWDSIQERSLDKIQELSPASAEMFSLQREVSALSMDTEMLSKAADGLASSIRNIQQAQG